MTQLLPMKLSKIIMTDNTEKDTTSDITDKFKDLDVAQQVIKTADTPLGIPQRVCVPHYAELKTRMAMTELLGQRKAIGHLDVTATQPTGTFLKEITFDYNYSQQHFGDSVSTATRFFSGFRAEKLVIEVEMISMMQQQGALIAVMTNMPKELLYPKYVREGNMVSIARLPRRFMPFGADSTYRFEIGWNSLLSFWPFSSTYSEGKALTTNAEQNHYMYNGSIYFHIFDHLKIATGVTDRVQLRFWAKLEGLEFSVYTPNGLL